MSLTRGRALESQVRGGSILDVLHQRCCGLEVHKSSISACILLHGSGRVQKHQRRFGAMTQDLHELAHWLKQFEVTQVAIAYASHCTSLGGCETFSSNGSLFDPSIVSRHWLSVMDRWIDGSAPGSSSRYSFLSLQRWARTRPTARQVFSCWVEIFEPLRHLIERQHSFRTQPLEMTLQSVFDPHATDHAASKWFAITGHQTTRVQDNCDGLVRMVIQ